MASSFERLVRFKATDGHTYYGDAGSDWESNLKGREVPVFAGLDPFAADFRVTEHIATIAEVRDRKVGDGVADPHRRSCARWKPYLLSLE
jgi:hypothetical protein